MARGRIVIRRPGLKTIVLDMVIEGCHVVSLRISGDFFVYPEEAVEEAEKLVADCDSAECVRSTLTSMAERSETVGMDWRVVGEEAARLFTRLCRRAS